MTDAILPCINCISFPMCNSMDDKIECELLHRYILLENDNLQHMNPDHRKIASRFFDAYLINSQMSSNLIFKFKNIDVS
jgi:hypothetical protein